MDLLDWKGRWETADDIVTATPCAALAATLDRDPPAGILPPLWHWLYFLPLHSRSELAHDGHARRGGFLPPVDLPRRMWAGGRFEFHRPIDIGGAVRRTSTIVGVDEKIGRSGALVFVKVRHDIRADGEPALTEYQDLVYREAARPGETANPPAAPDSAALQQSWKADEVLLFRYSALTFNAHRIHYDRRYVTEEEGYPGLVVHGPLIATLLVDLLRERTVRSFEFRAVSPLFDGRPFTVCAAPQADPKTIRLWAANPEGRVAMEATAVVD